MVAIIGRYLVLRTFLDKYLDFKEWSSSKGLEAWTPWKSHYNSKQADCSTSGAGDMDKIAFIRRELDLELMIINKQE